MNYLAAAASIGEAAALISALAGMGDHDFAANLDQAIATLEDAVGGAPSSLHAGIVRASAALARQLGTDMEAAVASGQDTFEIRSTILRTLSEGLVAARTALEVVPQQIPAAVSQLLSFDPCDPQNVSLVCAAQRALGIAPDGKYGDGTAASARALLPHAPHACSPRPAWWRPTGESNCGYVAPPSSIPSTPSSQPAPIATVKKGISTGAIVGTGLLALVTIGAGLYLAKSKARRRTPKRKSKRRR